MYTKGVVMMVVKERKKPIIIQQLEALLRRLPKDHSKRALVEGELAKHLAGFRGEESIEFYLSNLPFENSLLLHDIRLFVDDENYIQMDSLILTPNFFMILEVKNISGKLIFDPTFHQLIRHKDGKEEVFPDPLLQINRQKRLFLNWLNQKRYPQIPIEPFIVISNPSTIISSTIPNHEITHRVHHAAFLPEKMETMKKRYKNEVLSIKELKKLSKLIMRKDNPLVKDVLSSFQLTKADILTGVQCPKCLFLPMDRRYGTWACQSCGECSKVAHLQGIHDYFLLFNRPLTNEQCRKFLQIPSRHLSRQMLLSAKLVQSGSYKNRTYMLPLNRE